MARRRKNQRSIEMILWMDHCNSKGDEWKALETIKDLSPIKIFTVGWIVKETPEYVITLSTFYDPDGEHAEYGYGDLCIHKSCIIKRKKLV